MSVLIRGMEMPKTCDDCPLLDWDLSYIKCGVVNRKFNVNEEHFKDSRAYDCPLIEIPPHGDLIDRDALVRKFEEIEESIGYAEVPLALAVAGAINDIKKTPTVIEAEEDE